MIIPKKLRYLVFASLVITMPMYPIDFLEYCKSLFYDQTFTKRKIYLGVTAILLITLIRYIHVKTFLDKKCIDIDDIGRYDLNNAIKENDIPLILMLLRYKAPIAINEEYPNFEGSPLAIAIAKDASLTKLVLENGINIDQKTLNAALLFAIKKGGLDNSVNKSVELLLPYISGSITSFLDTAAFHNPQALELIIQHNNVTKKDLNHALFSIAQEDSSKQRRKNIKLLIKHGANVNQKELILDAPTSDPAYKQVRTPLSEAVSKGSAQTVRVLLKYGAQLVDSTTDISAYDYLKDVSTNSDGERKRKELRVKVLDNYRRKLAKNYGHEVYNALYACNLTKDTVDIISGYVILPYPLKKEYPLKSLSYVYNGCDSDSDED